MSDYMSEQDQLDLIKKWWQRYGQWLLNIILVIAVSYTGWAWYTHQQTAQLSQASQAYELMLQNLANENEQQAQAYAQLLVKDFAGSVYAAPASFWLAKAAIDADDFATAKAHLEWVITQLKQPAFVHLAKLRLAQMYKQQGNYTEALDLLAAVEHTSFAPMAKELAGDIYQLQGDNSATSAAYNDALNQLSTIVKSPLLKMKLDNVPA